MQRSVRSAWSATLTTLVSSCLFYAFFQISKKEAIGAANPFANDPYDAVGSFAVQMALGLSILTLARLVRHRGEAAIPARRLQLILRGSVVALTSMIVTLASDGVALVVEPVTVSSPLAIGFLLVGLAVLTGLALIDTLVLSRFRLRVRKVLRAAGAPPAGPDAGALADALSDLWGLADAIARWVTARIRFLAPAWRWVDRTVRRMGGWWDTRLPGLNPRTHAWRFFALLALAAGAALALAQAIGEGVSTHLGTALLVTVLFLGIEFAAAMLGYLLLGGFLGLRPGLGAGRSTPNETSGVGHG